MIPRSRLIIGAALLGALCTCPAHATQVVQLDTRALTLGSSDIVIGEVESIASRWNEAHTKILTDVTVRVSTSIKGAGDRIVLTQLGGTIGNLHTTVPGSPSFARGEEALVFAWRDARGRAQVNGFAQGKFEIRHDPRTGERWVQRAAQGMAVRDAHTLALVGPGESAPAIPLEDLVAEIRRALAGDGR